MLKVRIAELNRRALREVGADLLAVDPDTGNIIGTQIGGALVKAVASAGFGGLIGEAVTELGSSNTAFGIFPSDDFAIFLRFLRQNSLVRVLAEPNLMAMSGHRANFLAGGEYPIPVAQQGTDNNTIEFREFGVRLDFMPIVLDDGRVRLSVTPEVSTIDEALGTTLVLGGEPVPGLNTRRAHTTVELRQGQTLAIAGLLQVILDGQTARIPALGDLPIIGPLFSNTGHRREEKELLVLVTPYLVQPMEADQVPPTPGDCVEDPTDLELYLGNRIEGRTGRGHRSTTQYGFPSIGQVIDLHRHCIHGPVGFAE
jgi:pilus assembly protein CpaC